MIVQRSPQQVSSWFLAFHTRRGLWRGERFVPGRFSHVSAFAYLEGPKCWLLIDHSPRHQARVFVWPSVSGDVPDELGRWTDRCSILKCPVVERAGFRLSLGFWCVTAVKDLIGSASGALTPAGLWRSLTANGAQIIYDVLAAAAPDPGPASHSAGKAGADGAGQSNSIEPVL